MTTTGPSKTIRPDAGETTKVTRADVAREAKTSVAVVSYVINDGPRPVAAKTRQRVLDAIERVGYRPNGVAQALAGGSTRTLGLVVPDIANDFFAEFAYAVEQAARRAGRTVLLANTEHEAETESALLETFLQRRIDGVILVSEDPESAAALLGASRTPVVFLGGRPDDDAALSIAVDNEGGAYEATRHLAGHGYSTISAIAGPEDDGVAASRLAGWRRALAESGLDGRSVSAPFTVEGGYVAGYELLGDSEPPHALFASSDRQAIGLLRAAADRGARVPDDLAIVTFDGSAASAYAVPSLTTIAQPISGMAQLAVDRLLDAPADRGETTLPVDLLIRGSCGCEPDDRTLPVQRRGHDAGLKGAQ